MISRAVGVVMNKKPSKLSILITTVILFLGYIKYLELVFDGCMKLCGWLENRRRKEVSDDGCSDNGSPVDPCNIFEGFDDRARRATVDECGKE